MISDFQQEQAALYALGLLDADEAAAFERLLDVDVELGALVRDLRESAALLVMPADGSATQPTPALRARVLADARSGRTKPARMPWLPWAIAALFVGCSAVLRWAYLDQQASTAKVLAKSVASAHTMVDPAQLSFCALEPTPEFNDQPRAAVLWDAKHERGQLRVNRLAPPAEGKDYQLWAVESGRKEPVSAGVVHVGSDGTANIRFQPVEYDRPVVAVAISLEQAGGSATNKGPILLLGKF